jgi:thymidylate synthase
MNKLDKQYQQLLSDIIEFGVEKKDRTGTGTISEFGHQIRHKMSDGFPLLTTKKMAWKTMVTELLWFLRGDTNIKFLVDNNCNIWNGDAYQAYIKRYNKGEYVGKTKLLENSKKNRTLTEPFTIEEFIDKIKTDDEFAKKWGELGPIYGKQWRKWEKWYIDEDKRYLTFTKKIDQIANLINDLKTNPDSRRLMVNAWNVGELDQMVLPPCHYGFQVYTRELSLEERYVLYFEKLDPTMVPLELQVPNIQEYFDNLNVPKRAISLMWNQRSVDTFLGLPFNIASYGLLLTMIADEVNMVPDELIGNLGDTHIYLNHIEQAKEQIGREPYDLPKVSVRDGIFCSSVNDVILENYQSHPTIKAPLSN